MLRLILAALVIGLTACQSAPAAERLQVTIPPTQAAIALATAVPTTAVPPSATPTLTPSLTPTNTATPTLTPSLTATPTETLTPSPTFTPSLTPTIVPVAFFSFRRPFTREQIDYFDRTYPFGVGARNGLPVHHGVDFANSRGTPVLAIGAGTVYYAGLDLDVLFGPFPDYYGRLVVIQHDILSLDGLPVYSLYGHLQRAEVNAGDRVEGGQRIGSVGDAGVAFGPHLHLEIRVGDPHDFSAVRNPDMWLLPYGDYGTLLGRITLTDGTPLHEAVISIRRAGTTSGTVREAYSYADDPLIIPDPVWLENFSMGDLRSGDYEVFISDRSGRYRFRQNVTIEPGKLAFVEIILDMPVD